MPLSINSPLYALSSESKKLQIYLCCKAKKTAVLIILLKDCHRCIPYMSHNTIV